MKKILVVTAGVVIIFASIWLGAIGYNELPEGYQTASVISAFLGMLVGFLLCMVGVIEEIEGI